MITNPRDPEFYREACEMLSKIVGLLSEGHHVTLIVRHETNPDSNVVITSEDTDNNPAEKFLLVNDTLLRGFSEKATDTVHIPKDLE